MGFPFLWLTNWRTVSLHLEESQHPGRGINLRDVIGILDFMILHCIQRFNFQMVLSSKSIKG